MKHIRFEKMFTIKNTGFLLSFSTALWSEKTGGKAVIAEVKTTKKDGAIFHRLVFMPLLILVCRDGVDL